MTLIKRPNRRIPRARQLRQASTDAERKMWSLLRGRRLPAFKFRRQYPIGRYIADFACLSRRLAVELDGSQHALNVESDAIRTRAIEASGFKVIRFWNNDVLANPEGVLTMVLEALESRRSR